MSRKKIITKLNVPERYPLSHQSKKANHPQQVFDQTLASAPSITAETPLRHARSLQDEQRLIEHLKYHQRIHATIDLHHYSEEAAQYALMQTCNQLWHSNAQSVLIIHGKCCETLYPPLKNMVYRWVLAQSYIAAFGSMPKNSGGLGATCALFIVGDKI